MFRKYELLSANKYRDAYEKKNGYNASIAERLNQRIDDRDELERVVAAFEIVIQALSPESQLIITNEFVLQKNHEWWLEF